MDRGAPPCEELEEINHKRILRRKERMKREWTVALGEMSKDYREQKHGENGLHQCFNH